MPSKMQFYAQMADQAAKQITGSYQSWISFLQTTGRLYKYPYNEQVMIHAQRPDATACAEYDFWNRQWGRYVRRGSKGIALIDTSGENPRLRYVFDVSDTGTRENSRAVRLWELEEEHEPAIRDKRQCLKYLGRLSRKETDAIKEAAVLGIGGNVDIPEEIDAP